MSPDERLQRLLDELSRPISLDKLEHFSREFDALAQDRADTLWFFVLQSVCERLANALSGDAVSAERFVDLTDGIADEMAAILADLEQRVHDASKLERLVGRLFTNLGLYRA
ncbi:MAG: hypothetical protein ACJ8M4_05710 [Chthoniobacterales bacterium]